MAWASKKASDIQIGGKKISAYNHRGDLACRAAAWYAPRWRKNCRSSYINVKAALPRLASQAR